VPLGLVMEKFRGVENKFKWLADNGNPDLLPMQNILKLLQYSCPN